MSLTIRGTSPRADHTGHRLRVMLDETPASNALDLGEFVEIGGDEVGDIHFVDYLKGWDG